MILVDIDMPKNCYECPFLMTDRDTGIIACDICNEIIDMSEIDKKRSDVCPIKGTADFFCETLNLKRRINNERNDLW